MGDNRKILRTEETREQLELLRAEYLAWSKRRRESDRVGQYRSQLAAIDDLVGACLEALSEQLARIDPSRALGNVYEACRALDRRAVFVRKLWEYFRRRWDQRDDRRLSSILAAADEVIWSCWAPAFRAIDAEVAPAPLPFIDEQLSARAIMRRRLPAELTPFDQLLERTIDQLPVPLVSMPPVCISRPWWLALLAHETGHHVEAELNGSGIVGRVTQLVVKAGGDDDRWRPWARELFADAYGLACVGPAHVWALEELELAGDDLMARSAGPAYPPGRLRLAIASEILRVLKNGEPTRDTNVPPHASGVARSLVSEPVFGDALTLPELAGWRAERFSEGAAMDSWTAQLLTDCVPAIGVDVPRLVAAGAVGAWQTIAAIDDPARRSAGTAELARRVLKLIPECREPGTRAAPQPRALTSLADDTASALLEVSVEAA